jgi:TM2 domain-containing membrane protein YozV
VPEEGRRWFCPDCGAERSAVDASCSRCLPDQRSSSAEEGSTQENSTDNISYESDPSAPMMYCSECGEEISEKAKTCPNCGAPQKSNSDTSRVTAALLAFFLGGIGVHRFYIGRTWHGVLMLLFFWTFIPAIIAFIDFIRFLIMSDEEFANQYG